MLPNRKARWITRYSARGYPFQVWEEPMARIYDPYLDSVVYLYRSKEEAMLGENIGGSGFLLTYRIEGLPPPACFCYVVTNKHVVGGGATTVRMNTRNGDIDALPFKREDWHCSPTDDLAVLLIPNLLDQFVMRALPRANLITPEFVKRHNVGIGDEIILLGRFINREGHQRNSPTARFGFISQMPGDPIQCEINGKSHLQDDCFLGEVKSIGGYSGSAVLLSADPDASRFGGESLPTDRSPILGVDFCHIQASDSVYDSITGAKIDHLHTYYNTGMMGVIAGWKLADFLDNDPMVKSQRDRLSAPIIRSRNTPKARADAAVPLPDDDANPNHLEDFRHLVDVAARKRPQGDQT